MPRTTIGLAELPEAPHFLYWLFDRTDALLYIGITNDPKARFKHHRRHKEWWSDVDQTKTRIDYFPTRDLALAAEAKAIRANHPLYNDQHNLTVDTPANLAAGSAVREFADLLLHHMCAGTKHLNQVLADADDAIRQAELDPDDYSVYSTDRYRQAAIETASSLFGDAIRLRQALDLLLEFLPENQVKQCRQEAIEELEEYEEAFTEDEVRLHTATNLAYELAVPYMDTLPITEAAGWRATARAFLPADEPELAVEYHAARYAKANKAGGFYDLARHLCVERDWHNAMCSKVKADKKVFFNNCLFCGSNVCSGHHIWCEKHLADMRQAGGLWFDKRSEIIVANVAALPVEEDDPWAVAA